MNLAYSNDNITQGMPKQFVTPVRLISSHISSRAENSDRTKTEYTADIHQFFKIKTGKDVEYLTEKDLEISLLEVEEYRSLIKQEFNYANSTVNRKIITLRNLYKYFEAHYINNSQIRSSAFNVIAWKHDVQHYGTLSLEELERFAELSLKEKHKAWEKHYLILLAQRVSFRVEVLLNLKWSDIRPHESRSDAYLVTGRGGKGQKTHVRPIHKDFYEQLITLKDKYDQQYDDNQIFHFNKMDMSRMIKRFCKALDIDQEARKIAFHSIRRFGSNFIKNVTGDITLAKEQLDHEDIRTTMIYTDESGNVDLSVGMLLDSKEDGDTIENMTADDWKKLFESSSKETQINLITQLKNLR